MSLCVGELDVCDVYRAAVNSAGVRGILTKIDLFHLIKNKEKLLTDALTSVCAGSDRRRVRRRAEAACHLRSLNTDQSDH